MTTTSLLAYDDAKKGLGRKQQEVFRAIEEVGPATNKQLAEHLGWPINSITPRCLELRQKNKIYSCFIADDIGGRKANYWGTKTQKEEVQREYREGV